MGRVHLGSPVGSGGDLVTIVAAALVADEAAVRAAIAEVMDPEMPVVSIVDLGIVDRVDVRPDRIDVELLPTFVGCPALDVIRAAVEERLEAFGCPVTVEFGFSVPWTSDRITALGRQKLERSGFAPPRSCGASEPMIVQLAAPVACPHCGSLRTAMENAFGPSQCRSIHYCTACRQPFEALKPV
jgi:ring-1,2-phenylacetyl-CoA epoxidase subunit PaaD